MPEPWLESPYLDAPDALWLAGNLHTHTTVSDGTDSPETMVRRYAALGHDFLMLSDHDGITATEVDGGMILLPGNEICGGNRHVLHVGAGQVIAAAPQTQDTLDAVAADCGFAILCHPNWEEDFNHYPFDVLQSLENYAGVEILNGTCIHSPGSHLALDKWDRLLSSGRKLWGYANDDAHCAANTGLGWNVVRVRERSAPAILEALRTGSFYASSGVRIEDLRGDGATLYVRAPNAGRIAVVGQHGRRIHAVDAPELTFATADVLEPFIRIECYGMGDAAAWTQPFYLRDGAYESFHRRIATLEAAGRAELRALPADRAPVLSGAIDDPLWQQAPAHTQFVTIADGHPAPVATELRCIRVGDTLYFAVRCDEPDLDHVSLTDGRTGSLYADDSVEIFLDFTGDGVGYCQLVASISGHTSADWCGGEPQAQIGDLRARTTAWSTGQRRGWSLEFAVPVVGRPLRSGDRLGFHVCRNRNQPTRQFHVWSWVGPSNHTPSRFGTLVL